IKAAVLEALRSGYRHIDCAAIYGNEKEIGDALGEAFREGIVKREDIFVTSKLWNSQHRPADVPVALRQTLADLRLDYLDLYLMHWPLAFRSGVRDRDERTGRVALAPGVEVEDTWRAMEDLAVGPSPLTRAVGVSNFGVPLLERLAKSARVPIAVNQVEMHPYLPQYDLLAYCNGHNIVVTAYSPLGSAGDGSAALLADPVVTGIAARAGRTPAQVLVAWAVQRGTVVIPKSAKPERIRQNFDLSPLDDADFEALNSLHKTTARRFVNPVGIWGINAFADEKL
ncbi:hypothetical protein HK405_013284, partial [Cladochytrium tenue]